MTLEALEQILYNLTYENGLTFGMCGNASLDQKQMLVDAINFYEVRTRMPRNVAIANSRESLDCYGVPLDGRGKSGIR